MRWNENEKEKNNTNGEEQEMNKKMDRDVEKEKMSLFEQLRQVEWLLHRYHVQNHMRHGPMGDPHRGQGRVLALLKIQPEMSQKDLSYLLNMRPQSLGELLTKLERGGYIERMPSESDRRMIQIKLTEKGRKAAEDMDSGERSELFDCLTEEEQKNMSDYLERIIEALEGQMDDDISPPFGWRGNRFGHTPHGWGEGQNGMGEGRDGGRRDGYGRGRGRFERLDNECNPFSCAEHNSCHRGEHEPHHGAEGGSRHGGEHEPHHGEGYDLFHERGDKNYRSFHGREHRGFGRDDMCKSRGRCF